MGISDRLLGKKNVNGKPHIDGVAPAAALAILIPTVLIALLLVRRAALVPAT